MTESSRAKGDRLQPSPASVSPRYAEVDARSKPLQALNLESNSPVRELTPTKPVHLQFDRLQPFEVVTRQFQSRGVTFKNAIALVPSNPAYAARLGQTVLMGCPKSGLLEASFEQPVRFVAGFVTASRRTVMAAYDADDRPVGQSSTADANLATSETGISPNAELKVMASNIHRVTFQAFDGQLTLGELCFGN